MTAQRREKGKIVGPWNKPQMTARSQQPAPEQCPYWIESQCNKVAHNSAIISDATLAENKQVLDTAVAHIKEVTMRSPVPPYDYCDGGLINYLNSLRKQVVDEHLQPLSSDEYTGEDIFGPFIHEHNQKISRDAALKAYDKFADDILLLGKSDICPHGRCSRESDKTPNPWGCVKCIANFLRIKEKQ